MSPLLLSASFIEGGECLSLFSVHIHGFPDSFAKYKLPEMRQIDIGNLTSFSYRLVPCQWVFGIVDTQSRVGYVTLVNKRDKETLHSIITEKVIVGSVICSDE